MRKRRVASVRYHEWRLGLRHGKLWLGVSKSDYAIAIAKSQHPENLIKSPEICCFTVVRILYTQVVSFHQRAIAEFDEVKLREAAVL